MSATSHRKQIHKNIIAFIKKWKDESREEAEAKSFWDDFFQSFGIVRKEVAAFEHSVSRQDNSKGFIDLFWKGVLLVEHKSRGKSLDKAKSQAFDYFQHIDRQSDKPRYVLLSDFATFKLYDLEAREEHDIAIEDLADKINLFDFMAGLENHGETIHEFELNIKAAERLGKLHDALEDSNYTGHDLEVFLVRILFCLFAEDTGIFARHQFYNLLLNFTNDDGSDTDIWIHKLFQVLDKQENERNKNLMEELNDFPYVNGHLFSERLELPAFDEEMREALLDCALFDWSSISPAIFGSLFQSVMDKESRRELGAHYTSEENILKLINPLFLNELNEELSTIKKLKRGKQKRLLDFQQKLTGLQFIDPACGCGNFLIITYRELRRLELEVLQEQHGDTLNASLSISIEPTIKINHFHGIEIEEFPVRIAEVAMWLTQHQMNREFAKQFGVEPELLPLKSAAHIINDNALTLDWESVIKPNQLDYMIGNPPFVGQSWRSPEQKNDMAYVFPKKGKFGKLDFVAAWFYKAALYAGDTTKSIKIAFVSTNSIVQGESVGILWQTLLDMGIHINFAHRTFQWINDAKGKAAVHCVIIGFSFRVIDKKIIFDYPDIKGEPNILKVKNINPYLLDAPNVIPPSRSKPLLNRPKMTKGSQPTDGGNLVLTGLEKEQLLLKYPELKQWIRPYIGSREIINNIERYCFWFTDSTPKQRRELFKYPEIKSRIQAVKESRLKSPTESVREWADTAYLFTQDRQPNTNYLAVPEVSYLLRSPCGPSSLRSNVVSATLRLGA